MTDGRKLFVFLLVFLIVAVIDVILGYGTSNQPLASGGVGHDGEAERRG
jgi:hypothetical protein